MKRHSQHQEYTTGEIQITANPHKYEMINFQGRSSLNVWCGMLGNHIIVPLF